MQNKKENIGVIVSFVVVVGFIGLVVYILMNKTQNMNLGTEENKNLENQITNQITGDTSAVKEPVTPQTNNMEKISKNGDTLVMNYTGRLTNGTVFDSNVDPKFGHVQPFEFTLGAGQVIQGWDEGLVGMKIGEKKTLTIPPEKGYGSRAMGDKIPANSTLVFDVELVGIK